MTGQAHGPIVRPTVLTGHAHLDLAWMWSPAEARHEAVRTARSAVAILEEYEDARFVMSQAAQYQWLADDDPSLLTAIRELIEQGRWEPVGGWWVEADLFGASPLSIGKQAEVGQRAFERLVGRRCTVGFSPDTFGHPEWLPDLLNDAGMDTYVITRPGDHEAELPPVFVWEGSGGGRIVVVRPRSYFGDPVVDPSGLALYGVGNHGGGPTRQHLGLADELVAAGPARHGTIAEWRASVTESDLPIMTGNLVHHARGCYAQMIPLKERMRRVEHALFHADATDEQWQRLLFWQFHDVLAGTSVPEVYDEVQSDLDALEAEVHATRPRPADSPTYRWLRESEGRRFHVRETAGRAWAGWLPMSFKCAEPPGTIEVEDRRVVIRQVAQHGQGWLVSTLVQIALGPGEERTLSWRTEPGSRPPLPRAPRGVTLQVVEDGTDTWGHSLHSYGAVVRPSRASRLRVAGGPDGLVEVWGEWREPDRALKLVIPSGLLVAPLPDSDGEQPGGEWEGPVWGRVWSYDVVEGRLRITLRRSPPYAFHDPMPRHADVSYRATDLGPLFARFWLRPQPGAPPPEIITI